ncbi:MAG: 3-phosphoserine/phosphohydroxythreonine transaminase [bacterium]|nr:3-phosphoserine/phosphohydroxythreonine transaminase [bacterium]
MKRPVYNFGAGPAMLPVPVMQQVQKEFLDFNGMGVSLIEISHRSAEFEALLAETDVLMRRLTNLPDNYQILYVHGGAQLQFSAVPLNLLPLKPAKKALYVETGNFAKVARVEAEKFGDIQILASGEPGGFKVIPQITPEMVDPAASYVHITSNNTLYGTQYHQFPKTGEVPLVVDMTSEILSRVVDYSQFGMVYAGAQKNLGPSGISVAFVRDDLIGHAPADCPKLLDYAVYRDNHSMANTINTFAVYMINLVLKWVEQQGGVAALEKQNQAKASLLYQTLDESDFYSSVADPAHRSIMNVCFNLPSEELLKAFVAEAQAEGLYALKGHRAVGGARASIYNAMPIEGIKALTAFMKKFEQKRG